MIGCHDPDNPLMQRGSRQPGRHRTSAMPMDSFIEDHCGPVNETPLGITVWCNAQEPIP
jgi:hypothetical protein